MDRLPADHVSAAVVQLIRDLKSESDVWVVWWSRVVMPFGAVHADLVALREQADELYQSRNATAATRTTLETSLERNHRMVQGRVEAIPDFKTFVADSGLSSDLAPRQLVEGVGVVTLWGGQHYYARGIRLDRHQPAYEAVTHVVDGIRQLVDEARAQYQRGLDEVVGAAQRADAAVRRALEASSEGHPRSRPLPPGLGRIAWLPAVMFMLVALGGAWGEAPAHPLLVLAAGGLLTIPAIVVLCDAIHRRGHARATDVVVIGPAASIAAFAAIYLWCQGIDPGSISWHGRALNIFEACYMSALVALTGSPGDARLGAPAEQVAFVQLLLTLSAIAAVALTAWRRLTSERPIDVRGGLG